jgi:hypothetical protein
MSDLDKLPLIRCRPQPVPVGHPEHPDFSGYDDEDSTLDADEDCDSDLADELAVVWWRR